MFRSVNSVAVAVVVLAASFGCSTTGTTPTGGTAASGTNVGFDVDFAGKDGGATDSAAGVKDENTPDDIQEKSDIVPDVPTDVSVAKPKACDDPDNKPKCDKQHGHCEPGTGGKDATCKCDDGLDGDPYSEGGCSKNVNECDPAKPPVCGAGTVCSNLDPIKDGKKYECPCNTKASFDIPVSATECDCDATKHKKKNAASTQCICDESSGFVPDASGNCISSDVCKGVTCGPNMLCSVGADGKPVCGCVSDFYVKQADGCIDKKECDTDNGGCGSATFYKCIEVVGGPPKCSDIDLCKGVTCGPNMLCSVGADGKPVCGCVSEFFTKQGDACVDKKECNTDNGGCGSALAYKCNEVVGGPPTCADGNECDTGTHACDLATSGCLNTLGGYECVCKGGFKKSGKDCINVNECKEGDYPCDLSADCTDTVGSYECTCKPFYTASGKACIDFDECKTNNGGCGDSSAFKCTNVVGASPTCTDIDECETKTAKCSLDADCKNTTGGYKCTCKPGFQGDGEACTDLDECKTSSPCGVNSLCINTSGSFECLCKKGYVKADQACVDIDECKGGTAYCSPNAKCTNVPGDYTCDCNPGYKGDGIQCDVDKTCSPTCDQNAACVGVDGQPYYCACKPGYSGSGQKCYQIPFVVTMGTVRVQAFDPDDGMLWDSETVVPKDKKAEIDAALMAAVAAFVPGGVVFAKYVPLVTSLANLIAGFTSAPDPFGTATLLVSSKAKGPPLPLPEISNTYSPAWTNIAWTGVLLNSDTEIELDLSDKDAWYHDHISMPHITFKDLLLVLQYYVDPKTGKATYGSYVPVPTNTQSKKGILFVEVSLKPVYDCGNGNCDSANGESGETCPQDCKPVCGDGKCDATENQSSCPADCKAETNCTDKVDSDNDGKTDCADPDCAGNVACMGGSTCKPDVDLAAQLKCGQGDEWNNSGGGSTKVVDKYTCGGKEYTDETGSEYVYTYTAGCTGNATITVVKKAKSAPANPTYLDIFVLDGSKPCSGSSCVVGGLMDDVDTATVTFSANKGSKYFIAVDGYSGFAGDYSLTTTCSACP
jgi:hypothetical protein